MVKKFNQKLFRNLVLSLVLLVSLFALQETASANTIVDKSQVYLYTGEYVKSTRQLYLQPGSWLGIYVNEDEKDSSFAWWLQDAKGNAVLSGNGDVNKVIGLPVGLYTLVVGSGYGTGSANAILSVQFK